MLDVDQKEQIRRAFFIEGKSIRKIARERHHDRRTVRAAIRDAGPSRYKLTEPRSRPVLGPYVAIIDEWLAKDQLSLPKQRHTSRRIYHRLVEEKGYTGGESTVRDYVRQHRARPRPVFIPLAYEPGEDAQVDFSEAMVIMKGRPLTVQLFVGRLCYSKIPFLVASPNQQQEALFEGHEKSFDFFGGVPRTIWYDRMSQAVKKALPGQRPEEQEAFIAFWSHYLFESRFCNPREAHEKGMMEGDATSLLLRAFVDRVEITDGTRVVAVHERCYGREQAMTLGSLGAGTVAYLLRANRTPREPAAVLASAPSCPPVQDRDLSQYDLFIRR